jgi:actin-related protein
MFDTLFLFRVRSRATLLQSIVLSGGSTLLRGFGDRLLSELKRVRIVT